MHVTQTLSGAYIIECDYRVVKLGDGNVGRRIGEQAAWLKAHKGHGIMPVVGMLGANAYVMPKATDGIIGKVFADAIFDSMYQLLEQYVWSWPPETGGSQYAVLHKLSRMGHVIDDERWLAAFDVFRAITWGDLPMCLTHGDPTFVNRMWLNNHWVLCDPIPSGILPDIRALDLGKLLQSCFGFEVIMYGWKYVAPPNPYWVKEICENDNEWHAAVFFCLLHIMRMMPYLPADFHDEFLKVYDEVLRLAP